MAAIVRPRPSAGNDEPPTDPATSHPSVSSHASTSCGGHPHQTLRCIETLGWSGRSGRGEGPADGQHRGRRRARTRAATAARRPATTARGRRPPVAPGCRARGRRRSAPRSHRGRRPRRRPCDPISRLTTTTSSSPGRDPQRRRAVAPRQQDPALGWDAGGVGASERRLVERASRRARRAPIASSTSIDRHVVGERAARRSPRRRARCGRRTSGPRCRVPVRSPRRRRRSTTTAAATSSSQRRRLARRRPGDDEALVARDVEDVGERRTGRRRAVRRSTAQPSSTSSRCWRSRWRARDSRDLTVPGGAVEHLGHLGLGELLEVAQGDHRAVVDVEVVERGEHAGAVEDDEHVVLGRRLHVGRARARRARRSGGPAPPLAAVVARRVGDDAQEPRPERSLGVVALERRPRPLHGDLHDVVGAVAGPEHDGGEAEGAGHGLADASVERGRIGRVDRRFIPHREAAVAHRSSR